MPSRITNMYYYMTSYSHVLLLRRGLKEPSRPWVSNVTSADVSLTTGVNSATSLVNVMKLV